MTINGDGNVGIGTTTPNHSLSFGSPSNGTRSLALWENGTAFYGLGNDTNRLAFYASNAAGTAERMVLTSDGNVGIGTTAPVRRLTVESDLCVATGNTAYLWQTNTTNTNLQLWSKTASGDTGWGQRVYMTQSATSWAAGSDRRLKRDIVDHDGDLAEVLGLRVRSYNFNDDAADQPARYGFITDEVPASLGHLVTGEAGAVTIDEETGEEKPDPQGLFYTDLVPHLVGAIQELSAQNASLVVRIETLETA
ncbi:MAG: tail fiber domain-containing protein [Chloroflexi bacterium]|nr:tail fiber domain-containing protein [Chloroflexota bacterium]